MCVWIRGCPNPFQSGPQVKRGTNVDSETCSLNESFFTVLVNVVCVDSSSYPTGGAVIQFKSYLIYKLSLFLNSLIINQGFEVW